MDSHKPITEKEKGFMLIGLIISGAIILMFVALFKVSEEPENSLVDMLPENGTPALILQSKVGDDALPHIHQTWCQLLPYKRHIQDDRVFCYVEVITDWMVE